jgi:hypothetical protein
VEFDYGRLFWLGEGFTPGRYPRRGNALLEAKVTNLSVEPLGEVHRFAPDADAQD